MGFHGANNTRIQSDYEVRRTGLNRLCIVIDGSEEAAANPRLILNGTEAILIHDEVNAIVLPEFPMQYVNEMLRSGTVLIGEKESVPANGFMASYSGNTPVRRFYEASVSAVREGAMTIPMAANG